jgi:hypothetical protein
MQGGSNYLFPICRVPAFCDSPHRNFVVVPLFRNPPETKINNPTPLSSSRFFPDFHVFFKELYDVMIRVQQIRNPPEVARGVGQCTMAGTVVAGAEKEEC